MYNENINKMKEVEEKEEKGLSMEKIEDNKIKLTRIKENMKIKRTENTIKQKYKKKEKYRYNWKRLSLSPSKNNISSRFKFNIESSMIEEKNEKKEINKLRKIKYTYNVFEIIISSFLYCCMSNNLKIKKDITEKIE